MAQKGSVAVDGVSLTVNAVQGGTFEVNVIPHTQAVTVIGEYRRGVAVNIEVDIIARYLERLAREIHGEALRARLDRGETYAAHGDAAADRERAKTGVAERDDPAPIAAELLALKNAADALYYS